MGVVVSPLLFPFRPRSRRFVEYRSSGAAVGPTEERTDHTEKRSGNQPSRRTGGTSFVPSSRDGDPDGDSDANTDCASDCRRSAGRPEGNQPDPRLIDLRALPIPILKDKPVGGPFRKTPSECLLASIPCAGPSFHFNALRRSEGLKPLPLQLGPCLACVGL